MDIDEKIAHITKENKVIELRITELKAQKYKNLTSIKSLQDTKKLMEET